MSTSGGWSHVAGLVVLYLAVAVLAVAVGVASVTGVGNSLRDRGPLGNVAARNSVVEGQAQPDPDVDVVSRTFTDEFGELEVSCQGAFARGVEARPAQGWRTVSFESGPDDDIDAVFSRRARSFEIEVFCNSGEPTISETEQSELQPR